MAEFLFEYGLFLAKTLTMVLAIAGVVILVAVIVARAKGERSEHIEIKKLNDKYDETALSLKHFMATKDEAKQLDKEEKEKRKHEAKKTADEKPPRVFVLEFDGDMRASAVHALREEITAILMVASSNDEVFVKLNSAGGLVHAYGLAASQLARVKTAKLPLTIAVDKIAASGGYMMACIGDKIIAAPFAILGSIGVIAQVPNFHRLLKKHDVDFEMVTAGEYKRTLTMFGENTEKARIKFKEEIEDTHTLFKEFVTRFRPTLSMEKVATGEHWFGLRALELNLVDEIKTSDDYLLEKVKTGSVYEIRLAQKKNLGSKFAGFFQSLLDRAMAIWWDRQQESKLP